MLINHPQNSSYYQPSQLSSNGQPMRYMVARSSGSVDRPYCMMPYYQYQMMPVYYMPVSYGYNDKQVQHYRRVSLVSSSSVGDYIPSDIDLANSWEYQQSSDWSPQGDLEELSPNNDLSPYTDWERQEEISSQDLSPHPSPSPISAISVSELEARLEAVELAPPHPPDAQASHSESVFPVNSECITYNRDCILKFKFLKSDSPARQILDQVDSQCVQTLYSSMSTFNECADVIIYKKIYSTAGLISFFEEMLDEYILEPQQMPWFVLRVLIYVKYKRGKTFDSEQIANGKEVYKYFTSQAHTFLDRKIRDDCLNALEDEESSLTRSEAYNEFASFLRNS